MSAVSAESSHAPAGVASSAGQPNGGPASGGTDFGPNEWLVDELYQRYQKDPASVDRAWWSFFADYRPPTESPDNGSQTAPPAVASPSAGQPAAAAQATATKATQAPPAQQPAAPATDAGVPDPAARRRRAYRRQHGGQPLGPDRDLGSRGPSQAADRQPNRDQQPPGPRPGRKDLLHPPDRLRDRQGACLCARAE